MKKSVKLTLFLIVCIIGTISIVSAAAASETWSPTAPMGTSRDSHTATLLPNGKVLITGGITSYGFLASAEV